MSKPKDESATIADSGDLTIIYLMARSDGLSVRQAEQAVRAHLDTGCGYNFTRKEATP